MIVNNPFAMVVMIVAIVMLTSIVRTYLKTKGPAADASMQSDAEKQALIQEVKELKDRLHTLERITVEQENSLSREIDRLRDE